MPALFPADPPDRAASRAVNLASWDERAPVHAASPDYQLRQFRDDPAHLSDVVRFDLPRLGSVAGLRTVHLQCHIGTDSVSLARLGASVTGLDFSPAAVAEATRLAAATGDDAAFVQADVHDAVEVLGRESCDLVFTGIGALCWLPDVRAWARVVAGLLRPGGRLFLREGHPMLWALDETRTDELLVLAFPYVETSAPLVWSDDGTYVETDHTFAQTVTHSWNHGLGEIVTALLDAGLELTSLVEHDSVPWEALPGKMVHGDDGEWRLRDQPERLRLSYTLQATRRA